MATGIVIGLIGAYVIGHAIWGGWAESAWHAISQQRPQAPGSAWNDHATPGSGRPGSGSGGGGGGAW